MHMSFETRKNQAIEYVDVCLCVLVGILVVGIGRWSMMVVVFVTEYIFEQVGEREIWRKREQWNRQHDRREREQTRMRAVALTALCN